MVFGIEHAAFKRGIADVAVAHATLKTTRGQIDTVMTGYLLKGWTGLAAQDFLEDWDLWNEGAGNVLDGLEAMGELLSAAYVDFCQQDAESQAALDAVAAQIVETF